MTELNIPQIAENIFYVGSKDPNLRKFDAFVYLPNGTSYNSYLVKGANKTALIDTVAPGFGDELMGKLRQLTDIGKLDYVVMNHAEADHASAIPMVLQASNATLLTSPKGAKMAERFHGIEPARIQAVDFESSIDLGGKSLRFIDAAWLHWPETMFTYCPENKILFSGDFFGGHNSSGIFDDDIESAIAAAKSYFAEIMLPYRNWGRKGLDKIVDLDISLLAPTHGPVYKNVSKIMDNCRVWCDGVTRARALVAYVTIWGGTGSIAEILAESLKSEGVEVRMYDMGNMEFSEISSEFLDSRGLALVSPTILGNMHPLATYFMQIVKLYKPMFKFGAIVNSYGWAKSATKHAVEAFEAAKIESVGSAEIGGPPLPDDIDALKTLGKTLAARIIGDQ